MECNDFADIRHDLVAGRYEISVGDQLAVADYRLDAGRMIMTHTFVPPEARGRGLAEKLVRRALADAQAQSLKVVPACSYVAAFVRRHPEYSGLIATD